MKKKLLITLIIFTGVFSVSSQNALNFDGNNDYVTVPKGGGLNNLQSGTIEMWVRWLGPQDIGFNRISGAILGRQRNNHFNNHIIALDGTDPAQAKIIWRPYHNNQPSLVSLSSPGNNTWVHIAIVYESGNHTLYVNGIQEAHSNTEGNIEDNENILLSIGAWIGDGNSYSHSEIDEVRIWNVLRTKEEINDHMNVELLGNETGLITYFKFNQGVAGGSNTGITTLPDATSHNDGTLYNFALEGSTSNWVAGSGISTSHPMISVTTDITVQPNPAFDNIRISGLTHTETYTLYNMRGKSVLNGTISDQEVIDLKNISNGIYLLKTGDLKPIKIIKR